MAVINTGHFVHWYYLISDDSLAVLKYGVQANVFILKSPITGRIQWTLVVFLEFRFLKMLPLCWRKYPVIFPPWCRNRLEKIWVLHLYDKTGKSLLSVPGNSPANFFSFSSFLFSCAVNFVLASRVTQSKQLQAMIQTTWWNCDKTWQHMNTLVHHMLHRLIYQSWILLSSINWLMVMQKDFAPLNQVLFFIRKLAVAVQHHRLLIGRVLF